MTGFTTTHSIEPHFSSRDFDLHLGSRGVRKKGREDDGGNGSSIGGEVVADGGHHAKPLLIYIFLSLTHSISRVRAMDWLWLPLETSSPTSGEDGYTCRVL